MENSRSNIIMDKNDVDRTLTRIAHEIWERNRGSKNIAFIGIRKRGVTIAKRLSIKLKEFKNADIPVGALDINLYRDDFSEIASQPILKQTEIPFSIKDQKIILCDDFLYTGRTVRAALDAIIDLGRPKVIRLAVLIDRGFRQLPIQPNYVGKNVKAEKGELFEVFLEEEDGKDEVIISKGPLNGA